MPRERVIYHVTASRGRWKVAPEDTSRDASTFSDKEEAIAEAQALARSAERGQVIVHKQDGSIETEYSYGDPGP